MDRSEHIDQLAGALARAQGKYKTVKRSGKNPKFGSKYATLDDVIAAVRKALSEEELALTQLVEQGEDGFSLTTMLIHKTGQFMSATMGVDPVVIMSNQGKQVTTDLQALGSALTYTKRYQAGAMLGVNTETDDDGNTSGEAKKPIAPPQSEQAKAAREAAVELQANLKATRDAWIMEAQRVGLLSDPPASDEWPKLIEVMGPTYELYKSGKEPEFGFDKLREAGLMIITANALQPEQEAEEDTADAETLKRNVELLRGDGDEI
jgi:flagellar hook protein FlgE